MRANLKVWVPVYSVVIAAIVATGLIVAGGPTGVDTAVMGAVTGERTAWLTPLVSLLTELFSPAVVPVWALCVAGVLLARDRRVQRAAAVLASVVVAAVVAEVIKVVITRPRPPAIDQLGAYESTLSYPSGHVTGTAALLISVALVGTVTSRRATRAMAVVAALAVTAVVAWTRLYLGVHWLTDVSAGLLIGAATAALVVAVSPQLVATVGVRILDHLPPRAASWLEPPRSTGKRSLGA